MAVPGLTQWNFAIVWKTMREEVSQPGLPPSLVGPRLGLQNRTAGRDWAGELSWPSQQRGCLLGSCGLFWGHSLGSLPRLQGRMRVLGLAKATIAAWVLVLIYAGLLGAFKWPAPLPGPSHCFHRVAEMRLERALEAGPCLQAQGEFHYWGEGQSRGPRRLPDLSRPRTHRGDAGPLGGRKGCQPGRWPARCPQPLLSCPSTFSPTLSMPRRLLQSSSSQPSVLGGPPGCSCLPRPS